MQPKLCEVVMIELTKSAGTKTAINPDHVIAISDAGEKGTDLDLTNGWIRVREPFAEVVGLVGYHLRTVFRGARTQGQNGGEHDQNRV